MHEHVRAHTQTHDIPGLQKSGQVLSETGQNAHANRAQMHPSDNSRLCSLHLCVIWEDDGTLLAALGRKGRRGVHSVSVGFFFFAVWFCCHILSNVLQVLQDWNFARKGIVPSACS